MTVRATITLDDHNCEFVDKMAKGNRSSFINRLIAKERKMRLREMMAKHNLEEAQDEELHAEMALWDVTLMDGLEDEEDEEEW